MDLYAAAVAIFGSGYHPNIFSGGHHRSETSEVLSQNFAFPPQLFAVFQVLPIAPTAFTKKGTLRDSAMRRWLHDFHQIGPGSAAIAVDGADTHLFARKGALYEGNPLVRTDQGGSSLYQALWYHHRGGGLSGVSAIFADVLHKRGIGHC